MLNEMSPNRIERILSSGFRAVLVTAGGGSGALNALLSTPGASRFVSEAHVPYSPEALERFLGEKQEHSVSPATAIKLAHIAVRNQETGVSFLGIACTAALQTDRERRGADRAFICIKTGDAEKLYALYFSKASRAEQEALLSDWLLALIGQATGAERGLMLPGSFNPVHQGHLNLLKVAEEMTGLRGVFELSCANVDKPAIEEADSLRRAAAIKDVPVALTHTPRFIQKAELFPKTTFVLGYDTAARLVDPMYCLGTPREGTRPTEEKCRPGTLTGRWLEMWPKLQALETKFLVAGRQHGGVFQCLENLELPKGFEPLFEAIPESKFREDISSTGLRNV